MKKILSVLICLLMVMTLIPATVSADTTAPAQIKICNIALSDGDYLATNDATEASHGYTSGDYVALYKDGVLKLNNLNIINNPGGVEENSEDHAIYWYYSSEGKHDLVIELMPGTTNTIVDEKWSAINGSTGLVGSVGPSLTIQGNGTLNITGKSFGIWVWEDVIIQKGATVNVEGKTSSGISNNTSVGSIIIKQGTNVTVTGKEYGVSSDNTATGKFIVLGGNLTVKGETAAVKKVSSDFGGNTVYVSSNVSGEGSSVWNTESALTGYKYISLSGFSNTVTTYNVTKAATENGTIAVDFEKSMADETVTVIATPDTDYELEGMTVTDAESGSVTLLGEGNVKTFQMPAKNVTVSATFKSTAVTPPQIPTPASTTYAYAYDVQRSPFFPTSKGDDIRLYNLGKPLKYGSSSHGSTIKYDDYEGEWTLTEVGTYSEKSGFSPAPTANLDGVVENVAEAYDLNADGKAGLIIHKLTDESDALVGYGVVIGVDGNGHALFIGDLWNEDGAGYYLSQTAVEDISGEIEFGTEQMAQSSYAVSVSPAEVAFDDAAVGYAAAEDKTVTVANTGNAATGALTIALSGDTASNFTLSKSSISDIAVSGSDTFTVVPKEGLPIGVYSETITIKGQKIMPQTIEVSFEVKDTIPEPSPSPSPAPSRHKGNGELTGPLLTKKDKTDDKTSTVAKKEIILTVGKKEAFVFGVTKENDVAPHITNDRVMLPVRFVSENLGATVEWDGENAIATIIKGDVTIVIYIDKDVALVNDKEVNLDSPAYIRDSRTFVPIRFIAENLGEEVKWNGENQTVTITLTK